MATVSALVAAAGSGVIAFLEAFHQIGLRLIGLEAVSRYLCLPSCLGSYEGAIDLMLSLDLLDVGLDDVGANPQAPRLVSRISQ